MKRHCIICGTVYHTVSHPKKDYEDTLYCSAECWHVDLRRHRNGYDPSDYDLSWLSDERFLEAAGK